MSTRTSTRNRGFAATVAIACVAAVALLPSGAGAAIVATVPLGTTASYAVLGGSTVTNTGSSVLHGSLGLAPGTSITGFPPGEVVEPGVIDVANEAARQAQSDLTAAYVNAAGRPIDATTAADLADLTLQGGVYAGPSKGALALTGPLTLDGAGNPDSVFIFQTDSTLVTASDSTVNLINGAQACNVFWQVGSSATLGENSVFAGNILALTSISVNSNVTVHGRALARNGAVTLIDDTFTPTACAASTTTTAAPTTTTTVPGTTTTTAPAVTSPTTSPDTTPVAGLPVSGPVETAAPAPVGGTSPITPTSPESPAGTSGSAAPFGPTAPTSGGATGTATPATPTRQITTSSATPGTPTGGLARTGSPLALTFLLGVGLVALGSGAVRLSRFTR